MDFTLPPEIEDVRLRTRRFVEEHVIALEADRANYDEHENIRLDLLRDLQAKARAQGLCPPLTEESSIPSALLARWSSLYWYPGGAPSFGRTSAAIRSICSRWSNSVVNKMSSAPAATTWFTSRTQSATVPAIEAASMAGTRYP